MRYYESGFPVYASTDGIAYEIYLSGCKGYCEGCHSPHTWNNNLGQYIDSEFMDKIISNINIYYNKNEIDNICILGGEPLDNSEEELLYFINKLQTNFPKCKYYLYTHFDYEYVLNKFPNLLKLLDFIKCGKFIQSKYSRSGYKDPLTNVLLATSNQHFYKGDRDNEKI